MPTVRRYASNAVLPARYGFVVKADSTNGRLVFRASPDPAAPVQAKVATTLADVGVAPRYMR